MNKYNTEEIMWGPVLAVFFLFFYSSGDFLRLPSERIKRADVPSNKKNEAIEFFHNCSCVFSYQCDNDDFIITNGAELIDKRLGQKRPNRVLCTGGDFEGQYVCCKYKSGEEGKAAVTTVKPQTSAARNKTCGKPVPSITPRIMNEEDAPEPADGEFPWLVAIFKKSRNSNQWKFKATGSLIHPQVVLTANHAVVREKSENLKVITNGRIELGQIGDNPLEERNIKEIVKHPNYYSGSLHNDVALLILEESYDITNTRSINTICLKPDIPYENKRCVVAGWGKTLDSEKTEVLKKVELPILPYSKCEELLGRALEISDYKFHDSLMCAGGEEGKDTCTGDGGSPLLCSTGIGKIMHQVGFVVGGIEGIECGQKDVPGIYANVGFLNNWIVDQLKQRQLEI